MQRIAIILFLLAAGVGIWFLITQDGQPTGDPELEGGTPSKGAKGDRELAVKERDRLSCHLAMTRPSADADKCRQL